MASSTRSRTRRDRVVGAYVRRELYPHTPAARAQLDASPISAGRVRTVADLEGVAPMSLADAGDGSAFVVQPNRVDLMRYGSPYLRVRTFWASTWGRWQRFVDHHVEPTYRPVHFFTADHVPIGAAAADLIRLAGLGAEWMRALGVSSQDSVALLGGAGAGIEAWQLSGGTRRAGVSLAVVEDTSSAGRHGVSVLAGPSAAVVDALKGGVWPELRLVIVFGRTSDLVERRVAALQASQRIEVRLAFAVPGARSVWFECRGGAVDGWHTTASAELVEVDESGEALWTGIGWAGTVFLRLRTDLAVDHIDDAPCAACGHAGPRLFLAAGRPALGRFLGADPRVAEFRLTDAGAEVLPVRAGANARLVADARKAFPDASIVIKTRRGWTK